MDVQPVLCKWILRRRHWTDRWSRSTAPCRIRLGTGWFVPKLVFPNKTMNDWKKEPSYARCCLLLSWSRKINVDLISPRKKKRLSSSRTAIYWAWPRALVKSPVVRAPHSTVRGSWALVCLQSSQAISRGRQQSEALLRPLDLMSEAPTALTGPDAQRLPDLAVFAGQIAAAFPVCLRNQRVPAP